MDKYKTVTKGRQLYVGVNPPEALVDVGPRFGVYKIASAAKWDKNSTGFIVVLRVRCIRYKKGQLQEAPYKRAKFHDENGLTTAGQGLVMDVSEGISTGDFPRRVRRGKRGRMAMMFRVED
jgi:hypothetical protein